MASAVSKASVPSSSSHRHHLPHSGHDIRNRLFGIMVTDTRGPVVSAIRSRVFYGKTRGASGDEGGNSRGICEQIAFDPALRIMWS